MFHTFFFIFLTLCTFSLSSNSIKGVVLIPDKKSLLSQSELVDIEGIKTYVDVPGGIQLLQKALWPAIEEKPFSFDSAKEIKLAVTKYFYDHGDPFVLVYIPDQKSATDVLQLIVLHAKVGTVKIEGNQYVKNEKLLQKVPVQKGNKINLKELDRSLYQINLNPFQRVDLIYSPGKDLGVTDITMYVQDRRPYRFYTGFNNSGVETTGRQRWIAGMTLGNLFGTDQLLSFQYMTSYTPKRFQAYTLQYIAPTYKGQLLTIYGGYSDVSAKNAFFSSKPQGQSLQTSFRYEVPLYTSLGTIRKVYGGFDFKRTNNTIEFSQVDPNRGNWVNLSQFIVGYRESYEKKKHHLSFNAETNFSFGPMFPDESNFRYNSLRPHAKNHWFIARGSGLYTYELPLQAAFLLKASGQIATQNLLPSEQIGLGGLETVRGYTERQLNYDSGVLATAEIHSPKIPIVSMIRGKNINDALHLLLFMDFGWGANHNLLPGEKKYDYILGIGPAIRYNLNPYISASCDWGMKLHQEKAFDGGETMLYFNVLLSY